MLPWNRSIRALPDDHGWTFSIRETCPLDSKCWALHIKKQIRALPDDHGGTFSIRETCPLIR